MEIIERLVALSKTLEKSDDLLAATIRSQAAENDVLRQGVRRWSALCATKDLRIAELEALLGTCRNAQVALSHKEQDK